MYFVNTYRILLESVQRSIASLHTFNVLSLSGSEDTLATKKMWRKQTPISWASLCSERALIVTFPATSKQGRWRKKRQSSQVGTRGSPSGEYKSQVGTRGSPSGECKSQVRTRGLPSGECKSQLGTRGLPSGKYKSQVGTRQLTFAKFLYHDETPCNVLELVDNFGFLISFFFDKFIC